MMNCIRIERENEARDWYDELGWGKKNLMAAVSELIP